MIRDMMAYYMKLPIKSIIDNCAIWLKEHKSVVIVGLIAVLSLSFMFALGFVCGRLYNPPPLIIE